MAAILSLPHCVKRSCRDWIPWQATRIIVSAMATNWHAPLLLSLKLILKIMCCDHCHIVQVFHVGLRHKISGIYYIMLRYFQCVPNLRLYMRSLVSYVHSSVTKWYVVNPFVEFSNHSEIWQTSLQYCCQDTFQISKWYEHFITQSRKFQSMETSWGVTIGHLIWYWTRAQWLVHHYHSWSKPSKLSRLMMSCDITRPHVCNKLMSQMDSSLRHTKN